jgi:hypothetical protein
MKKNYQQRLKQFFDTEDGEESFNILEGYFCSFEDSGEVFTRPLEKEYFNIWWFDAEVQNGGIHQYFYNGTGDEWEQLVKLSKKLSFEEFQNLLSKISAKFPNHYVPSNRDQRDDLLDVIDPDIQVFDELTAEYNEIREKLLQYSSRYFKNHKSQLLALPEDALEAKNLAIENFQSLSAQAKREIVESWIFSEDIDLIESNITEIRQFFIEENDSPFFYSLRELRESTISLLIKHGFDINIENEQKRTPLFFFRKYEVPSKNTKARHQFLIQLGAVSKPDLYAEKWSY